MLFYDFFNPIFFTASTHSVLLFAVLFWFWGAPDSLHRCDSLLRPLL
ncbi:hypothetical protein [Thermogymnomonas acidicola]|nr:hypothetical protein [Thermogymnomonas acidicola]